MSRFKSFKLAVCAAVCLMGVGVAQAATQTVVGGQLTGATGVDVGGALYDVSFVEGSCVSIFSGCDSSTFTFQTSAGAQAASASLLSQVFLDSSLGLFDTNPELTFGLSDLTYGETFTPYSSDGLTAMRATAVNCALGVCDDYAASGSYLSNTSISTVGDAVAVWAVWTPTPIPEPEIYAMLGVGLGLLGWVGRRRKQQAA